MNQQLWSGLTTAALIITSLGTAPSSHADQSRATDESSGANVSIPETQPEQVASSSSPLTNSGNDQPEEPVKVGEYQSQNEAEPIEESVAAIQPHLMGDRQAATLYVRDIPVFTFLETETASGAEPPLSPAASAEAASHSTAALNSANSTESDFKIASTDDSALSEASASSTRQAPAGDSEAYQSDPVWRATAIAARLNQFHRDSIDAESITVSWDGDRERYIIKVGDAELLEMNSNIILSDTTENPAEDALQAANRLRRLLGDAPPLREIAGRPRPAPQRIALGPIQFTVRGMASWYGPGFNGRRSASGEVFNQNALTAAHRSLPFGTRVRVTNLRNGQSVVVRINDRGPFSRGRIIDLSAGAARAVGLIQAGVAPVNIDVLGTSSAPTE